jgi:hypothetical protein
MTDVSYPFEFSVPALPKADSAELRVDALTTAGKAVSCQPVRLNR